MYSGEKEDLILKPLSSNSVVNKYLMEFLTNSEDSKQSIEIDDTLWDDIESVQHNLWERELQQHRLNTSELINYKLGILTTSHQSRIAFIKEQIRKANNIKIRMMREAELKNANNDFELRKNKLESTIIKADIVVSKLSYGILIIE